MPYAKGNKVKDQFKRMREASGSIKSDDKLVSFIYSLGRDYLTLGQIEEIMLDLEKEDGQEITYSNGWLAQYAMDVAERLK